MYAITVFEPNVKDTEEYMKIFDEFKNLVSLIINSVMQTFDAIEILRSISCLAILWRI